MKRVGAEFKSENEGTLAIATTHTQARYVLPRAIERFVKRYPTVRLGLRQGARGGDLHRGREAHGAGVDHRAGDRWQLFWDLHLVLGVQYTRLSLYKNSVSVKVIEDIANP